MAIVMKLYNPSGTEYDVTTKAIADSLGELSLQLEDETCKFLADDFSITFRNEDDYFTNLITLPIDPSNKYNESTGSGQWCLKVYKAGSLRFEGDIDPESVEFNAKEKAVSMTFLGAVKRSEISGHTIKRVADTTVYFTNERRKRILSFYTDITHTTPKSIASIGLAVGDRIKTSKLKLNGNIIDQELEIKQIGSPLADNQAKTRQGCRRVYEQGIVINGFWRGLSVADCVNKCFDAIGVPAGNRIINGAGTSLVVDELNTEDKTVAGVLTKLAEYSGCIWFRETTSQKWYFIDRETAKSSSYKDITSLLCEQTKTGSEAEWYDSVIVEGTPPHFAPHSKARRYRYGRGRGHSYSIKTDYTSSLTTLATIAQQIYNRVCKIHKIVECEILDDGTVYNIWDKILLNGEYFYVTAVTEPLRGIEYKGTIRLTLKSVNGTIPAGNEIEFDNNDDEDPPYPPDYLELGKGTDNPSNRPSWWAQARSQYPGGNTEFPIRKVVQIVDDDNNPKTAPKVIWKRLWFIRWKATEVDGVDGEDVPDGFKITVYTPDKGIEKPLQIHGYSNPKKHSDGYYYYPIYLSTKTGAPEKCVTIQTFIYGKDLSAYSEEVSTANYGNAVEDDDPFAGVTFNVTKVATDDYTLTFELSFTKNGSAYVVGELEKIQICKSSATATEPNLQRKQPPLLTLDHNLDPARCTQSTFKVIIPHAYGTIPRVWFRPVAVDGHKMNWTYDTAGGSGYDTAPTYVFVQPKNDNIQIDFKFTGITADHYLKVWIQTGSVTGTPESGSGWATSAPNNIAFSSITISGDVYTCHCYYYDTNSAVTSTMPATAKIIMAVYDASGTRTSDFSVIYDYENASSSIPQPVKDTFSIDDNAHTMTINWAWSNTFTGYAYALSYYGSTSDCAGQPLPTQPYSYVMTPAQYEGASQYQTNSNNVTFNLKDFGETGHKYKTLTNATSLSVTYSIGSLGSTTLYGVFELFLFKLDSSGHIIFGQAGSFRYYADDYFTFPDLDLYRDASGKILYCQWLHDGTNYHLAIQEDIGGSYRNFNFVNGVNIPVTNGYKKYNCAVSALTTYRVRLVRPPATDYGGEYPDNYHGFWFISQGGSIS